MRAVSAVVLVVLSCFAPSAHANDGDYDPAFGGSGVVTPFDGALYGGGGVLRFPDGMILAAHLAGSDLLIARYDATGVLDAGFGSGGVLTLPAPSGYLSGVVALPGGGYLLLAGDVLVRYDASWNLDASFGSGGTLTLPDCGPAPSTLVRDVLVAVDGSLTVAASTSGADSCVMRFGESGAPDATFGVAGVVTLTDFQATALVAQGDRVVVGGLRTSAGPSSAAVLRLLADGSGDGGFGDGGLFAAALDTPTSVSAFAVRGDGSLLALTNATHVIALSANGKLDRSFGADGVAGPGYVSNGLEVLTSRWIFVERDGRVIVAGSSEDHTTFFPFASSFLVRFDVDGTLDPSFGVNGRHASISGLLVGAVRQPDDKIVVAGPANPDYFAMTAGPFYVARHVGFTLPCPASAALGCRGSTAPAAGGLRADAAADATAKFQWGWGKGDATNVGDFGDPVAGDDVTLCFYDESGGSTLVGGAVVPGGGLCKGKPCWKPLGTSGFAYKDAKRARFGFASLKLKAGPAGKAKIGIKGQGANVPTPPLPVALPMRLQLRAATGQCWEATFSAAGTSRNDAARYQGKAD